MKKNWSKSIFPVILQVPSSCHTLKGRKKADALSAYARRALFLCTEMSGVRLEKLNKDERGAPVPENGIHWSISHKSLYVAAVCSPLPVGIDIEKKKLRSGAIFDYIADNKEWERSGNKSDDNFFRLFTAKEAILKAYGEGLKGLKNCRLKNIIDKDHLIMSYKGNNCAVEHFRLDGHISSIAAMGMDVIWKVMGEYFV